MTALAILGWLVVCFIAGYLTLLTGFISLWHSSIQETWVLILVTIGAWYVAYLACPFTIIIKTVP